MLTLLNVRCSKEKKNSLSLIEVTIKNHAAIDSIIVYDKENSWKIKTCLRFGKSNYVTDTLNILTSKLYPLYMFSGGEQLQLGEVILSQTSKISITLDENNPFETINFKGDYKVDNNFLAFSKNQQNILSEKVKEGVETKKLELDIIEKRNLITKQGDVSKTSDSLKTYVFGAFDIFSDILKKKNIKYLYKSSLIGSLGNDFVFKNIKNESLSLTKYKGKFVYIDVWATWCKPCKAEYIFLK